MPSPVPIICYHSVSTNPPGWIDPYYVSPAVFAAHLDEILASGRQPLTVSQFVDGLDGRAPLPPRPVMITFDDGFADFADHALPALSERNMPSTLFVTTGALSDRKQDAVLPSAPMLASTDLAGLEAAGVEIGAHSHTHRQLDLLSRRAVTDEAERSGSILADILGHHIRAFAYPHSYWKPSVRRILAQAGFDSSCAIGEKFASDRDHRFSLSRFMLTCDADAATVRALMSGPGVPVQTRRHRVLAFGWRQVRRVKYGRAATEYR